MPQSRGEVDPSIATYLEHVRCQFERGVYDSLAQDSQMWSMLRQSSARSGRSLQYIFKTSYGYHPGTVEFDPVLVESV